MKKLTHAVLFILVAGCGGDPSPAPSPSGAGGSSGGEPESPLFLTVVGASNVSLGESEAQVLSVKYHDSGGHAVAGEVAFALQGASAGAHLDRQTTQTDALGVAQVQVVGGTES